MTDNKSIVVLPDWIQQPVDQEVIPVKSRSQSTRYLVKTIKDLTRVMADSLRSEVYARSNGLLQKVDPRIKLGAVILCVIAVSTSRSLMCLAILWFLSLFLMGLSHLPFGKIQLRVWGFVPLITFIAGIPAMLNIINDGQPLVVLYTFTSTPQLAGWYWPESIYISKPGLIAVLLLSIRVGLCLTFGVLLALTTPLADLVRALRILRVPGVMVVIMEMTYRYIILLLVIALEIFQARKMRTVGNLSLKDRQGQVFSGAGTLFAKSMFLAEEVFQAMTARGYTGKLVRMEVVGEGCSWQNVKSVLIRSAGSDCL
ncbi:cobalt ECF transporter T component CbiQ [Syntrophomonas erecta]